MITWLGDLAAWSVAAFGILLLVTQSVTREAGYFFGRRRAMAKEKPDEGVGLVVTSILGLMVFVLAFNLSMATSRAAERRQGTLQEANAIGTAWLQATAIDHVRAAAIAKLLENYTEQRLTFVLADRASPDIDATTARTSELQTEIWGHMTALAQENPGPVTTSLLNALNHTFDMTAAMRYAMAVALPHQLVMLLFALNLIGMAVLGYQFGLQGKHHRALAVLMSLLWTAVMVEILDIGTPRVGMFRTDVSAYQWTQQGFTEVPIPPLPG